MPGLYAAGECASGPHGANRLAGHMLCATQVFGTIAARHAAGATRGKRIPKPRAATVEGSIDEIERFLELAPDDPEAQSERDLLEALKKQQGS